jgi:hypothetical protein
VDDGYGGTRLDWTDVDELDLGKAAIAPVARSGVNSGDEVDAGRQGTEIVATLYLLGVGFDVEGADRISTPAQVFEVDGQPEEWSSPWTGEGKYTAINLRVVEG